METLCCQQKYYLLIHQLCSISNFSLSGLGLTCIPNELLQQLPNLAELNLSKNKLSDVNSEKAFPKLKVLSAASNQLSNVDGLTAFPNLISLDVTSNPTLEVTNFMLHVNYEEWFLFSILP